MTTENQFDHRGYDLDYYNLFLRKYLSDHRFPEAEDDLFIATRSDYAYDVFVESRLAGDEWHIANEKAMEALYAGFEMSVYDFISELLLNEFQDHISLEEESIEFWTYTFMEELKDEFKGVTLSTEFLNTPDGAAFQLSVIGRITLFFEENGL